ncbi:MAG: flagellar hook assembly protein FlgD [Pseudomonadota bacterium]
MPVIGKPALENKYGNVTMKKVPGQEPAANPATSSKPFAGGTVTESIEKVKSGIQFVDAKKHNQMGKDEFLKLLTFQLSNQDPTAPMDNKRMGADMAQFASLEQMTNMNTKLEEMKNNTQMQSKFYAASFLGKVVTTSGTTIDSPGDGQSVGVPFALPKEAKTAMVRLFDKKGQLVRQLEVKDLPRGSQSVTWDGLASDGTIAAKDTYMVSVQAWDENYQEFKGETKSDGLVTGVKIENGEVVLDLDRKKSVFLRDVENFRLLDQNKKEDVPALQRKTANEAYQQMAQQQEQ